jgi:hypothetical protein
MYPPNAARPTSRKRGPSSIPGALRYPEDAAEFLGCSVWTLAEWRCKGIGPRFVKVGGRVRYAPEDLTAWIASRTVASTSEHDAMKVG